LNVYRCEETPHGETCGVGHKRGTFSGAPKVLSGTDTRSTEPWLCSIFLGWYVSHLSSLKGHLVDICKISLLLSMAVTKTSADLTVPKHAWYPYLSLIYQGLRFN
jgi:hypothetical protein